MRDENGNIDLGKFNEKVKGDAVVYREEGGWIIDKDKKGHGGKKWKLKDKKRHRVASLSEDGKILSD